MKTLRLLVLLGLVGAVTGGCAAAGLATGPLMTAIQVVADRSVERTVPAELAAVWTALEDVLSRNALRIEERGQDGDAWRLTGRGEKITVHASLVRVTPKMTRLAVRVETGGIVADRTTSEQIHAQVALAFTDAPHPETADSAVALTTVQDEIRRLRSEIETKPAAAARRAGEATGGEPLSVNRAGVVTIPVSYGLATVAGPAVVATPWTPAPAGVSEESRPSVPESAAVSPLASPLRPVSALTAVSSMAPGSDN